MSFSKFKTGDWLVVAGGAVMLIFGLVLDWASIDTALGSGSGNSAFDYFFTGGLAYLLVVAAGVIVFLLAGGVMNAGTTPWPIIVLAATGLATLLMLVRLILGAGSVAGFDLDRGPGMYVAFVAAAVALAGAIMNFTASGGNLKDLTDMDKMRGAFNRPDAGATVSAPPPPPPPVTGQAPPPPPPPVDVPSPPPAI